MLDGLTLYHQAHRALGVTRLVQSSAHRVSGQGTGLPELSAKLGQEGGGDGLRLAARLAELRVQTLRQAGE